MTEASLKTQKFKTLRDEAKKALEQDPKAWALAKSLYEKVDTAKTKAFCIRELKKLNEDPAFLELAGVEALSRRLVFRLGVEALEARLKKLEETKEKAAATRALNLKLKKERIQNSLSQITLPENQAFLKKIIKIKSTTADVFKLEVSGYTIHLPKAEATECEGFIVAISDKYAQKFYYLEELERSELSVAAKRAQEEAKANAKQEREEREQRIRENLQKHLEKEKLEQAQREAKLKADLEAELLEVQKQYPNAFLTVVPNIKNLEELKFHDLEGGFIKVVALSHVKNKLSWLSLKEIFEEEAACFADFIWQSDYMKNFEVRYVYAVKEESF